MSKHLLSTSAVLLALAALAFTATPASAQGFPRPLQNTPFDPGTWNPGDWISRPSGGSYSDFDLVPDPVVIRNASNIDVAYSINGQQQRIVRGNRLYYQFTRSNYAPLSIAFDNGQGRTVSYTLGSGKYVFQYTPNGLNLFRDDERPQQSTATQPTATLRRVEFVADRSRFAQQAGDSWTEFHPNGQRISFREVRRTAEGVELFDPNRNMYVFLTSNQGLWRLPTGPWNSFTNGRWTR